MDCSLSLDLDKAHHKNYGQHDLIYSNLNKNKQKKQPKECKNVMMENSVERNSQRYSHMAT